MYHCICNTSSTTGNARGAGTAYSSGAPAFSHVLVGYVLLKLLLWLATTLAWLFVDTFVLLPTKEKKCLKTTNGYQKP
jgi:hypothetical protein